MAQPVTPQDHIAAAAQRVRDQQTAAKELALKLAAQRAGVVQAANVEPSTAAGG